MSFERRVLHYSPGPSDFQSLISDSAILGCWFELHRQGGCGAGELRLKESFADRNQFAIGDWIAFEYQSGVRWYLGQILERISESPAGVLLKLKGMSHYLADVFPGGYGSTIADHVPPHRFASADLFPSDPDHADEAIDAITMPSDLVTELVQQYVTTAFPIAYDSNLIEADSAAASVTSLKVRGEDSVWEILQEIGLRARNAAWGVNEQGQFYFLKPSETVSATFQEGIDLIQLREASNRKALFNRVVLTGDLLYQAAGAAEDLTRGHYRWQGNYIEAESRDLYGERRIRIWVPWIRTATDASAFIKEFFRVYSVPTRRYQIDVGQQSLLPKPWEGLIRLLDRTGSELITSQVETLHVQFDHAPRFRMRLGPRHPHELWPQPPQVQRTALPNSYESGFGGAIVNVSGGGGGSGLCAGAVVCDQFNDDNGTELANHTMDIGNGWTEEIHDWEIDNNEAVCVTQSTSSSGILITDTGLADVVIESDITIGDASNFTVPSMLFRYLNDSNYWSVQLNHNNSSLQLLEMNGGSWAIRTSVSHAFPKGEMFPVVVTVNGNSLSAEVDGVSINYTLNPLNENVTTHGFRSVQSGTTLTAPNRYSHFKVTAPS